jgi:creatinine amidohydrolase
MKWGYLREEEFKGAIEKSGGLCVMVLGCLEKHGQHLPVGTDSLKGDKLVELAAEKAEVVMFPTAMWLGDVSCHHSVEHPETSSCYGFVSIKTETLLTVLEELCDEIARNGFTKILLLGSHGGNTPLLQFFERSQLYKKKNYLTMIGRAYDFAEQLQPATMYAEITAHRDEYPMITDEDIKTLERFAETGSGGGHGDFRETMLVQGTYPELVREDKFDAEYGRSTGRYVAPPEVAGTLIGWFANFPNNFSGFAPIGCSRTIGEAAVKMAVDRLVKMFEYLKNNDTCLDALKIIKEQ